MNSLHGADNGNDQLTQHQLDMNQQHFMEQQMLESQRASMQQAMFRPPNMVFNFSLISLHFCSESIGY